MAMSHVNFGNFSTRSKNIRNKNDDLKKILNDIQKEVNRSESNKIYLSDSGAEIRKKITNMQQTIDKYYKIVDNYANFIQATGDAYRATEQVNLNKANKFI